MRLGAQLSFNDAPRQSKKLVPYQSISKLTQSGSEYDAYPSTSMYDHLIATDLHTERKEAKYQSAYLSTTHLYATSTLGNHSKLDPGNVML